jgi:hypothetical protein
MTWLGSLARRLGSWWSALRGSARQRAADKHMWDQAADELIRRARKPERLPTLGELKARSKRVTNRG